MDKKISLDQQWAHLEAQAKALLLRRGVSTTVLAGHTTKMVALAEEAKGMDDDYGEKLVALSRRILPTHPDVAVTALAAVVYYCPAGFSEANPLAQELIEDHRPLFKSNPEAMRRIGIGACCAQAIHANAERKCLRPARREIVLEKPAGTAQLDPASATLYQGPELPRCR